MKNKTDTTKQERIKLTEHVTTLVKDNFITFADQHKALQIVREALLEFEAISRAEWEKKNDTYIAYCSCGDALERTGLYPNEARYFCFGCDKQYKLVWVVRQNRKGE